MAWAPNFDLECVDKGHMKANSNAYLRTKVMTANPAELRLMLLDGAIRFAEQARTGLEHNDYEACYLGISRCQSILLELINGLKPEHDSELCRNLAGLYTFMYTHLMKASSKREPALIDEVLKLLEYERQTWQMLLEQLVRENRAANSMIATPDAQPTIPPPVDDGARSLIGGTVSVRG